MKVYLMYRDRDFDVQQALPVNHEAVIQDLELDTVLDTMAAGDKYLRDVARSALLGGAGDLATILYRQEILADCLKNPAVVQALYEIAVEAIARERKYIWGILYDHPMGILRRSVSVIDMFMNMLQALRRLAEKHAGDFKSEGFTTLFAMLAQELDDAYFAQVRAHLKHLSFRGGVWISANLGQGNKGEHYVLRKPADAELNWLTSMFGGNGAGGTITVAERDESGTKALSDLKDRGINLIANALAQSNDHILSFFQQLRAELGFYLGSLHLQQRLAQLDAPISFPTPAATGDRRHASEGLYDLSLALTIERSVVGNDVNADGKTLVMITGANQGGKSTFLRSIGIAQLMMQCGMFVPAVSFTANLCSGLFTHFRREEDSSMQSGKLDEELSRMSDIVDHIRGDALILFNESFAATNEREGSEIGRQILRALLDKRIKVFFVTHLFDLARSFYEPQQADALFLRPERQADGIRTFRLYEGEPLQTSFGEDVYNAIFGEVEPPVSANASRPHR